ncbi:MAG: NAD-dependent epimerase/dehydratase family protein [Bacteroidota bacterium]
MKVLLLGGTGCLGGDVAALAAQRSDIELCLLNRGNRPQFVPDGARCIYGDLTRPEEVLATLEGMTFDVVCDFLSYGVEQLESNLGLFGERCGQYVFVSSGAAYRIKSQAEIITEDKTMLGNTLWSYGRNKILCERRLAAEGERTGLQYTIVRPAFTYNKLRILHPVGPGHQTHSWTIADRMLKGKPLLMHDDGKALCTVTHTEDFAKGFVGLFGNSRAFGEAVHITSDEFLTWNRVAELVGEALGVKPNLCHVPAHDLGFELGGDFGEKLISFAQNGVYDNSKIRALVPEFVCTTHFAEGIRRTIQFYRDNPEFKVVHEEFDRKMDEIAEQYHGQTLR